MKQQPIKFVPIIKDKIWGGQRLNTLLGKDLGDLPNGGESWELSAVKGNVSIIANGELKGMPLNKAIETYGAELVGSKVYVQHGNDFPLLIKFIDAADNLSVQVHPDDKMAKERHNSFGKTEMWYVLDSDEGAQLISGFARKSNKEEYQPLLDEGKFVDILGAHTVRRGDVFFMPAGRIHAIGKGVMVAEIQQTSDITYRVFDYNRRDAQGNSRELHVEEAKEALNFNDTDSGKQEYTLIPNQRAEVVSCPFFKTGIIAVNGTCSRDYSNIDSFVILMCVKGNVVADGIHINYGETALVPACSNGLTITADSDSELLEVYL